jgi:hypothetical protein
MPFPSTRTQNLFIPELSTAATSKSTLRVSTALPSGILAQLSAVVTRGASESIWKSAPSENAIDMAGPSPSERVGRSIVHPDITAVVVAKRAVDFEINFIEILSFV